MTWQHRAFSLGKNKWMSLIKGSSLQENCNKECFNYIATQRTSSRIGIKANNERDCITSDSGLGIGLHRLPVSCGNICGSVCKNGGVVIPALSTYRRRHMSDIIIKIADVSRRTVTCNSN